MAENIENTGVVTEAQTTETQTEETKTYTQEEVLALLQSETDKRVSQALKTQQKKYEKQLSLSKLDGDERAKAEKDNRIAELEEQLAAFQIERNRSELKSVLSSRGLSAEFADIISISDDIEASQANIDKLDKLFKAAVKAEVEKRLAGNAPKANTTTSGEITKESAKKMSLAEINELAEKNRSFMPSSSTDLYWRLIIMANTVFANKVIEAKAKDLLTTAVNTRSLMTVDNSLAQNPGMTKTINVYTYSGTAEELAAGVGNTSTARGKITYAGTDYTVKMVQQAFDYLDEDFMKDNTIVDNMLKGANQVMVNKMTADFITECGKATLSSEFTNFGYDAIVDGISTLNLEDESKLFLVIPNAWKASLRKDADYKAAQMGQVIYNGQVGTICGIPVICTKALTDKAYVMTNEAVKLFMKKDVEVEQDRDADKRTNSVYLRTAYICALVDATKICELSKKAA